MTGNRAKFTMPAVCLLIIPLLFSCSKDGYLNNNKGIDFNTTSQGTIQTKTSYSGERYGTPPKERIDWCKNDMIRIHSPQCTDGTNNWADYVVDEVTGTSGAVSKAKIKTKSSVPGYSGLNWSETPDVEHMFYAVYPSPEAGSITKDIVANIVTADLPASQSSTADSWPDKNGNYILKPDMTCQMMVAQAGPYKKDETVELSFTPMVTAIRFQISNGTAKDMMITKVELLSDAAQIAGPFTTDMATTATDGYPSVTGNDATATSLSITIPSGGVTLKSSESLSFTFFLAPTATTNDLRFRVVKKDGTLTTRLGYTDGTGVMFPRCKISSVTGLLIPEGAQWTVDYQPILTPWEETEKSNIYL